MTIIGACSGSTPRSPSAAGITTISTGLESKSFSGLTTSSATGIDPILGCGLQRLGLFHRLLDRAHHVERRLGQIVMLTRDDSLEAANRIGDRNEHAGEAGKDLGHMEGLREETLDF